MAVLVLETFRLDIKRFTCLFVGPIENKWNRKVSPRYNLNLFIFSYDKQTLDLLTRLMKGSIGHSLFSDNLVLHFYWKFCTYVFSIILLNIEMNMNKENGQSLLRK